MLVSDVIIEAVAKSEYERKRERLNASPVKITRQGTGEELPPHPPWEELPERMRSEDRADIRRILGVANMWGFHLPEEPMTREHTIKVRGRQRESAGAPMYFLECSCGNWSAEAPSHEIALRQMILHRIEIIEQDLNIKVEVQWEHRF